jgi:hypothetical protein
MPALTPRSPDLDGYRLPLKVASGVPLEDGLAHRNFDQGPFCSMLVAASDGGSCIPEISKNFFAVDFHVSTA